MLSFPTIAGANSGNDVSGIKKTTEYSIWFSMITGIFCVGVFLFYGDFIEQLFSGDLSFLRIHNDSCLALPLSLSLQRNGDVSVSSAYER